MLEELKSKIYKSNIPSHIAIIMDGNGRWAKKQAKNRIFGHRNAIKSVRDAVEGCAEIGVKNLTLYSFSLENWNRPKNEVNALMELFINTMKGELKTLMKNNVKLSTIGNTGTLPKRCQKKLQETIKATENNNHINLILALCYSARWEIENTTKKIAKKIANGELKVTEINQELISKNLETKNTPDPELMIRTSGEYRISNFMLWQMAYTELIFIDILWPDFRKKDLFKSIINYQKRERRFGKTSEQIKQQK